MNAFEKWCNKNLSQEYALREIVIAKHRELCHHDKCKAQQILAFEQGIAEAYAKGKEDGHMECHDDAALNISKSEAYKKGQADLIGKLTSKEAIEELAELENAQWREWSNTLAVKEPLSKERIERWKRLWIKPYNELSESEKEQDRVWARKVIAAIKKASESLGANAPSLVSGGKRVTTTPKPEKPKTALQRDREVRESRGQRKPKKVK